MRPAAAGNQAVHENGEYERLAQLAQGIETGSDLIRFQRELMAAFLRKRLTVGEGNVLSSMARNTLAALSLVQRYGGLPSNSRELLLLPDAGQEKRQRIAALKTELAELESSSAA